jgi:ketosteroid isomerase-like protein
MMLRFSTAIILLSLFGCKPKINQDHSGEATKGIRQTESNFEKMAHEKGIAEAFEFYADSNAVIKRRNDSLITGRENIRNFYSSNFFKSAIVNWEPDFVETSPDGNLGYTYGKYTWISTDRTGKKEKSQGVFHTVWKKQKDGSWKYVWD